MEVGNLCPNGWISKIGNFPRSGGRSYLFWSSGIRIVLINDMSISVSHPLPIATFGDDTFESGLNDSTTDLSSSLASIGPGKALPNNDAIVWVALILRPLDLL